MDWYNKIQIAENWQYAFEKMASIVAREEIDLQEYEKKKDHNPTAVLIRKEKISHYKTFMRATKMLIDAQANELSEINKNNASMKYYAEKYEILEKYASSKGIDTSLINYMKKQDFNIL